VKWPQVVCIGLSHLLAAATLGYGQLVLSGNENKIDLTSGQPRWIQGAQPDSLSLIRFDQWPPTVRHLRGISNSVIGPPSNLAITPDGRRAVLADSIRIDSNAKPDPWVPCHDLHLLDLVSDPPRIIDTVSTGAQPSGLSLSRDGTQLLVANRAEGTISLVQINADSLTMGPKIQVCDAAQSVSDVAINADGTMVLASIQNLAPVAIEGRST
jgi:hypothetical protein